MNLSFIIRLLATSGLAAAGYSLFMPYLPPKLQYHHYSYILFFFALSTAVFHYGLSRSAETGSKAFIRYYMGATGIKLLIYVAIIVIYATINKPGIMAFALCFLVFYILFTILETMIAFKQFGGKMKTTPPGDEAQL